MVSARSRGWPRLGRGRRVTDRTGLIGWGHYQGRGIKMEKLDPLVVSLHGSIVELTLRVGRIEKELGLAEPIAMATFVSPGFERPAAPTPDYGIENPCGCDESVALRSRVRQLEEALCCLAVGE